MALACAASAAEAGLVEGLVTSADCHISNLVQTGYGAFAGPDSPLLPAMTAALTIYVALMGLRLMLGLGTLRIGELTLSIVKIGVILTLATNWPLYHRLVFETLFHGPEQLAGGLLKGAGEASPQALHGALQLAFDEMQASAQFFAQKTPGGASPWIGGPGFSAAAVNLASVLMLVSTLGVLLGLRIVLAVLLLAGPLFIGFFLFQSTRGVFVGWLRAATSLALSPLFALLALVLQLQLIQPHLASLAMLRAQGGSDVTPAVAILVITLACALVTLLGLCACAMLGMSLRLPSNAPAKSTAEPAPAPMRIDQAHPIRTGALPAIEPAPRVASVAAAAAALERRDLRVLSEPGLRSSQPGGAAASGGFTTPYTNAAGPSRRRTAPPRAAASSARRDG